MNAWIKIENEIPPKDKKVLLTDGTIFKIGKLSKDGTYWDVDEPSRGFLEPIIPVYFTHWTEIPPIEGNNN